jgi:glycosyltransferase involved in cell wall biosynthesis
MKICFIAPEFLPIVGGVGTHIVELIRHLPKDIEIHVLTLKRKIPNSNVTLTANQMEDYFNRDITVHIVTEANDQFIYNAKFQIVCYKWIQKLYKEEGIDLFHSHFGHMPDLLVKLRGLNIPIITTAHVSNAGLSEGIRQSETKFKDLEIAGKYSIVLSPFLNFIERRYIKRCTNIIAVSNWMKNILIDNYGIDERIIEVIPNGVDPNLFRPNIQSDILNKINVPIVLFTGRLTSTKGINYLIEAIPKVLSRERNVHFVFVGGGYPKPYLNKIEQLGISPDYYTYLGYIKDYRDMAALYSKASVYVAPTLFENLPIRILEAMSAGTPVIASNVCAIPEAIEDGVNGFLIPPKDVEALSDKIVYIIQNKDLSKKMGISARTTILSMFVWDEIGKRTAEYYKKVIGDSN